MSREKQTNFFNMTIQNYVQIFGTHAFNWTTEKWFRYNDNENDPKNKEHLADFT